MTDIFAIQDEVASGIASTLVGRVELEVGSGARHRVSSISSYDDVLGGMWHFKMFSLSGRIEARRRFERAIDADPGNAEALRWLAISYFDAWLLDHRRPDLECGLHLSEKAVELDQANAQCHSALAICQLYALGPHAATPTYRRALELNPGDLNVLVELGLLNAYTGDHRAAHRYF